MDDDRSPADRSRAREMIAALLADAYARTDEAHGLAMEIDDWRAGRIQDARGRLLMAVEVYNPGGSTDVHSLPSNRSPEARGG